MSIINDIPMWKIFHKLAVRNIKNFEKTEESHFTKCSETTCYITLFMTNQIPCENNAVKINLRWNEWSSKLFLSTL